MERKYPNLSKPIKIGNVLYRNRMFGAPMGGTDITKDCTVGDKSVRFYENRAKGGAATVTVSELVVHPKTEASHMYHLDLQTVDSLASFTYTADAIRRHGAIASVELSHSGQYAGTYLVDKEKKDSLSQWGPSDTVRPDGREVKALTKELIAEIVESYGEKAALAKKAGFEMVMVHAGHGWLINQFLSPYFNKREDEYGGSLENRARILLEVLDEIRAQVGPGFPIELRMSGSELFDGGYDLEEGVRIAKLVEDKVDLIHVSAGTYQRGFGITHPSMFTEHGVNVYLAAEIKKHVSKPVATIGGLNSPEQMEEIIASGKADIVEMARALLADPQLPNKVMENRDDEIVHCLRCFVCMAERAQTGTRRCTVNPVIGRESDGMEIIPARNKKKVMVVGAGPGGLQSALTAARRGHEVILCEKEAEVGGILVGEQAISFKQEMYQLGNTLGRLCEKEGVDIRLNTTVTKELVEEIAPDALIVATGSEAIIPPVKGIDGETVIGISELHHKLDKVGNDVVVLGGGLAGSEAAVHFAREGKNVTIVEMNDKLSPDANIRHRPLLLAEIEGQGIDVRTNTMGMEVTPEGLVVKSNDEVSTIPASSIILAAGQRSRSDIVLDLYDTAPVVKIVGDCVKVSTITTAVYQGHHAALDI